MEDKAKQAAEEHLREPAAMVEGKSKQASGSGIKPARVTVPANYMEILKARMAGPEPKVVEVKTKMVQEDYILRLKEKPPRRAGGPLFPPNTTSRNRSEEIDVFVRVYNHRLGKATGDAVVI